MLCYSSPIIRFQLPSVDLCNFGSLQVIRLCQIFPCQLVSNLCVLLIIPQNKTDQLSIFFTYHHMYWIILLILRIWIRLATFNWPSSTQIIVTNSALSLLAKAVVTSFFQRFHIWLFVTAFRFTSHYLKKTIHRWAVNSVIFFLINFEIICPFENRNDGLSSNLRHLSLRFFNFQYLMK